MIKLRFVLLIGLILISTTVLYARGNKEKNTGVDNTSKEDTVIAVEYRSVRVEGVVRLVGSSPFSELVITGPEFSWYVASDEMYKLQDLQHRTVVVEGEGADIEQKYASGISAGTRHQLRNIRIISIQ